MRYELSIYFNAIIVMSNTLRAGRQTRLTRQLLALASSYRKTVRLKSAQENGLITVSRSKMTCPWCMSSL